MAAQHSVAATQIVAAAGMCSITTCTDSDKMQNKQCALSLSLFSVTLRKHSREIVDARISGRKFAGYKWEH